MWAINEVFPSFFLKQEPQIYVDNAGQEVGDNSDDTAYDRQVQHTDNEVISNSLLLTESGTDDLLSEEQEGAGDPYRG